MWERASVAYKCNDLKMLQETDFLVQHALSQLGEASTELVIPDIQNRIIVLEQEIHTIISTEPYSYKTLLEDEESVKREKHELNNEIDEFREYEAQLRIQLDILMK